MKHYLVIENGIITALHGGSSIPEGIEEITTEKYNALMEVIKNKPEDTLEAIYRLSAETEQYEAFERTEEEVIQWYTEKVNSGMDITEVPEEYRELIIIDKSTEDITQSAEWQAGYDQAVLDLMEV